MVEVKPLFEDDESETSGSIPVIEPIDLRLTGGQKANSIGYTDDKSQSVKPLILPDDIEQTPRGTSAGETVSPSMLVDDLSKIAKIPHIRPLELPDSSEMQRKAPPGLALALSPITVDVFAVDEHPSVAPAMERGADKYPDVIKKSGYLVRNALSSLVPVTFESLSAYGESTLSRAAGLVDKISAASKAVHEIDAQALIKTILERAAPTKHKSTLLVLIGSSLAHFDPVEATNQLSSIKNALTHRLQAISDMRNELESIRDSLVVEATTIAILADMTDHAEIGAHVVRKGNLINVSLQEVQLCITQVNNIKKSAEEWIMRCDEVKTITLPALGFRSNIGAG